MATISSRQATARTVLPLRDHAAPAGAGLNIQPVWHRSASRRVAQAEAWGTGSDGWKAWSAELARVSLSRSVAALFNAQRPALGWALPATAPQGVSTRLPATGDLLIALDRIERGKSCKLSNPIEIVGAWLAETGHRHGPQFGIECVAWAAALPALAALLPGDSWWQLVDRLLHIANAEPDSGQSALARQWLNAELALTLAYVLPELKPARTLARRGGQELAASLRREAATEGMPAARLLDDAPALLASWARSRVLARRLKKSGWNAESEQHYAAFARQVLRLLRRDATPVFSATMSGRSVRDMLATAFQDTDRADRALAMALARRRDLPGNVSAKALPSPAANNEAAGVTVLRRNWSRGCERVVVARSGPQTRLELSAGRDVLWTGAWTCEVRRDGELLVPDADAEWDEVCWTSNEDADYLELELALPQGMRVQRQIVLAREDRFLFIADAVLGTEPATLEYRGALPLATEVRFDPSTESREGYLVASKPRGLVFPLSLAEWRAEPTVGALATTGAQALELSATRQDARSLYVPLFIDLHPRRLFRPATWRRLTVAENRQILAHDVAVGYRVQVRDEHWLVYRSLEARGNRTLLGHNLVSEFLVARFKTDGEIEPLVEIE